MEEALPEQELKLTKSAQLQLDPDAGATADQEHNSEQRVSDKRQALNGTATDRIGQYRTACFNCRAARQRCDRYLPCSRCTSQGNTCRYPLRSNRGRKEGSTNKPDSLEKLLARINESPVKDQVIAAVLNSLNVGSNTLSPPSNTSPTILHHSQGQEASYGRGFATSASTVATFESRRSSTPEIPDATQVPCPCYKLKKKSDVVSPLQIMTAAIAADAPATDLSPSQPAHTTKIDERLLEYLTPRPSHQKDWQVLSSQSNNLTFKLESTACDPITARLVDQDDVKLYFEIFFKTRNPLVGLLDHILHTPEYVFSESFTLFSVICALGCAISTRPRDRVIYSTLLSLAQANVMWSIATCVKSLETVQAIICMTYWTPIYHRQADDPYWLHLSHAIQLARELGIHKPAKVAEQVNAMASDSSTEFKERMLRNFERTWLQVFIADKGFGIVTGRSISVAWNELPPCPCQWWKLPNTSPSDRMVSGIIEIRVQLLGALKQLERGVKTPEAILSWHSKAFGILERTRNTTSTCTQSDQGTIYAQSLHVLAFYMDHSIMVLNAQALRELKTIDDVDMSTELSILSRKAFDVACRVLDLVLWNATLRKVRLGWQNNQFIMIAHAITEILHAIKRGNLPSPDVTEAASKVQGVSILLEDTAKSLPDSSAAHIYAALSRVFASQVERISSFSGCGVDSNTDIDPTIFVPDWLRSVNGTSIDPAFWHDVGFLSVEQLSYGAADFNGIGDLSSLTFN